MQAGIFLGNKRVKWVTFLKYLREERAVLGFRISFPIEVDEQEKDP